MNKHHVTTPFFMVNTKSYLRKDEVLFIAKYADQLAEACAITIFMIAPHTYLEAISTQTRHVIVTAQHMDGIEPGRGMGSIVPESIIDAGAEAVYLNHAERPMTLAQLVKAVKRGKEIGLITIVCSDSIEETKAVAMLHPDIILCEQSSFIESGRISDERYMKDSIRAVKEIHPEPVSVTVRMSIRRL